MDLSERLSWFIAGCVLGVVIGYIIRDIRDIKEEVDEVDGLVKRKLGEREDDGFMNMRYVRDIAVLLVVIMTAWAAVASQKASNDVKEQQARTDQVVICTSEYLAQTIRALNLRTDAVQNRADANLELQKAQSAFFQLLLEIPPLPETDRREAAEKYVASLEHFVEVSDQTKNEGES